MSKRDSTIGKRQHFNLCVVEPAEPTVFPKAVTPSAYSQEFPGYLVRMKYDVAFKFS